MPARHAVRFPARNRGNPCGIRGFGQRGERPARSAGGELGGGGAEDLGEGRRAGALDEGFGVAGEALGGDGDVLPPGDGAASGPSGATVNPAVPRTTRPVLRISQRPPFPPDGATNSVTVIGSSKPIGPRWLRPTKRVPTPPVSSSTVTVVAGIQRECDGQSVSSAHTSSAEPGIATVVRILIIETPLGRVESGRTRHLSLPPSAYHRLRELSAPGTGQVSRKSFAREAGVAYAGHRRS